ncbi:hypothetical protein HYPSUDRAFT_416112 [Hypholoma sublateritium FD-334 SS-4]|uniref:Uncharacterized protein n=1 Tax=Hypholoma sublateritium (strain FD-334 SS-4) TaxID=945553 RepID=A0A0D2LVB9_HYPSF|nr:hypothetical protein HYPSUDRAFT_416112 [Hypholoma sublateritium FD-334 SS-4]
MQTLHFLSLNLYFVNGEILCLGKSQFTHHLLPIQCSTPMLFSCFCQHEWEQECPLAQFVVENLPRISSDPELGEAISKDIKADESSGPPFRKTIYYENCPVGPSQCLDYGMCNGFQRYNAQLRVKQISYDISNARLDYLQVCILPLLFMVC